ncbi:MAG: class II aldolase/adducin family protein [Bradyrhizobium sp.]|nr:class II aldolase/adducin family protein [Bradyrhizobium sp.]
MSNIPLDDLIEAAAGCRVLHAEGHADMTLGHLSFRDPHGRGVWMKRSGIGLGEVAGPEDFVLLSFEGERLAGEGRIHKEWPIHTELLRARLDVNAAGHSHPFYATLFSSMDLELEAVTNEAAYLGPRVARFEETRGLIDTQALGASLALALGDASTLLLRNHGVLFVGATIPEAVLMGVFLERACRSQIELLSTKQAYKATPKSELFAKKEQILDPNLIENFWSFYKRKADGGRSAAAA